MGGHPIAGAETSGVENAQADLFEGAVWYLTPLESSSGLLYERLHRLVKQMGARPVAVDPDTHDRLVAVFSHLPHVRGQRARRTRAPSACSTRARRCRHVGPSFRDATRVAGANTAMWTDVYAANREAVVEEVRRFARSLDAAADILESGEGVAEWNDSARADRRRLLEPDLGEGRVHELRLMVPEPPRYRRPGGAGAGQSGREHRGHGAGAGRGHAHGVHHALDRGGRRGRPRGGADRRARLSRNRAVSRDARFAPSGPLQGSYTPPADKSISHRAALFAAMSDEPVVVHNYLEAADTVATLDALRSLGAGVDESDDGAVLIRGVGLRAPVESTGGLLNVQNSGTLMRLLPGWLAGQPGRVWTLDGDESIRRRPVDRVAAPLADMGARRGRPRRALPAVHDPRSRAGRHRVRAAGGQRTGQVLRPDRRHARRRLHHRARAGSRAATTPSA